jgi:DNA-binding IclR family transcriptional regulator
MPRSTNRAFDILELVSASPRGLKHGAIAQSLDIPKSTLTKIIKDLVTKEYLEFDNVSSTYSVGPQVLVLARSYLGNYDIVKIAYPFIIDAMTKTGESASLFIMKGNRGLVIAKENSSQILSAMLSIGESVPLYATAGGKAILAFLSEDEIEAYLATVVLQPLTAATITDKMKLRQELQEIRHSGLAFSNGEQFDGLVAIAAPIFGLYDRVIAAISLPFPKSRFNAEKREIIESTVRDSSATISRRLGGNAIQNQSQAANTRI